MEFQPSTGMLFAAEFSPAGPEPLFQVDPATGQLASVGTLIPDVGMAESIVFCPSGALVGSASAGAFGANVFFEIDPFNATVSNITPIGAGAFAPQGMDTAVVAVILQPAPPSVFIALLITTAVLVLLLLLWFRRRVFRRFYRST